MKKMLLILSLVAIAGCAGSPTPIPAPESEGAKVYKERERERERFRMSLPPASETPHLRQWMHLLKIMEKQMRHEGTPPMTASEKAAILEYLKKHSR